MKLGYTTLVGLGALALGLGACAETVEGVATTASYCHKKDIVGAGERAELRFGFQYRQNNNLGDDRFINSPVRTSNMPVEECEQIPPIAAGDRVVVRTNDGGIPYIVQEAKVEIDPEEGS